MSYLSTTDDDVGDDDGDDDDYLVCVYTYTDRRRETHYTYV